MYRTVSPMVDPMQWIYGFDLFDPISTNLQIIYTNHITVLGEIVSKEFQIGEVIISVIFHTSRRYGLTILDRKEPH